MAYTVGSVSEMAGVSVRTLHHYDEIGLLRPAQVSASGYRLYTQQDLERLQQVLFFRELGFSLQEIGRIIDSADFDRRRALLEHRGLLLQRQERLGKLVALIDRTLEATERGVPMDGQKMFDGFDQSKYEEEARQRWGQTREYQESAQRTGRYTKDDWATIKAEGAAIEQAIAGLMDRSPSDPEVQEWVGRHHQQINDRFYTCSAEVYRSLGEMYVADERFRAHYEQVRPGMAQFMKAAMDVYCDQLAGK